MQLVPQISSHNDSLKLSRFLCRNFREHDRKNQKEKPFWFAPLEVCGDHASCKNYLHLCEPARVFEVKTIHLCCCFAKDGKTEETKAAHSPIHFLLL